MKLGIMQPYFFPYLGYFDLIYKTDKWIVFDTVQYISKGWMNRNRIYNSSGNPQYIIVPLQKHSRNTNIQDIVITENSRWKKEILDKLIVYKKAPYYNKTLELIRNCLSSDERLLSKFNVECLNKVCDFLGIKFSYQYFSEMNLKLGEINDPGDWSLEISKAMNASEYINPPGGNSFITYTKFNKANIKLTFLDRTPIYYKTNRFNYIPRLSIIDTLMWLSPSDIKEYLDKTF